MQKIALVSALCAAAATGCGGGSAVGDIRAAIQEGFTGKQSSACERFTDDGLKRLGISRADCRKQTPFTRSVFIGKVSSSGELGKAHVKLAKLGDADVSLVKDGSTWKVDDISNVRLSAEGQQQQQEGQDASARSDARNMVSQIESCYTDTENYGPCQGQITDESSGLSIGAGPGMVEIADASETTYTIVAHSETGVDWKIVKDESGNIARTCSPIGQGDCASDGTW